MSLRLLTYNVRYSTLDSGDDVWAERRDGVASVIRFHDPDVVCLQEVWRDQLSDLEARLPAYAWVHAETSSGEHTPIGYRPDRVTVRDSEVFSLSESPRDLHAMDWDTTVPRVTTAARLAAAAPDAELLVANTHLDHDGERARRRGASLLADRLGDRAGPTVVAGDLNSGPSDPPCRTLTDAGFRAARALAEHPHGPLTTYNDFEAPQPGNRLDYVLVDADDVAVDRFGVLADLDARGRFPSDHFPVLADLDLTA